MNYDLDNLIKQVLLNAEKQLHLDVSEFVNYAVNQTYDFEEKNEFFQRFNKILFEDIEKMFIGDLEEILTVNKDRKREKIFYYVFSSAIGKAKRVMYNTDELMSTNELTSFGSDVDDFMFYQVYFNGYVRYAFVDLFTISNYDTIKKLKKFDITNVIQRFKYYIDLFTINKLRISYSYDILGNFDVKKEIELNSLMKLMIEQHEIKYN